MKLTELTDGDAADFVLRRELREREARMLAFLYNVEHEIVAEKFDQKFAVYSQLKSIQKNESIKTEEVKRIFLALSQKLHQRVLRQEIEGDRALNKLQTLWEVRKIEPFHRYYFEKYIHSTYVKNVHALVKRQDALIRQEQHIYFSILRGIWARQACMNHIGQQLKQMGPEDVFEHCHTVKERGIQRGRKIDKRQYKVHGFKAQYRLDYQEVNLNKTKLESLFQDINNYRKLTVHLIELIVKWRDYMFSLTHDIKKRKQRVEYYYKEKNHLLEILNDINFVSHSFLANFFTFSVRNDPFLLRPILTFEKKAQQTGELSQQEDALKTIAQIPTIYLPQIISCIQHLHNQLETNIRNRKVSNHYAMNKAKNMSLDQLNVVKHPQTSPLKRIKLNPLINKSQVILNTGIKKEGSVSSLSKSNVIIRKSLINKQGTKTFYGNNPQTPNPFKMLQSDQLKSIKQQVFKKVKQQLEYQTRKSLLKSKQFVDLIDFQVKTSMNQILQKQKNQLQQTVWQVSPLSFPKQQISSYLAFIFKFIPVNYLQMQLSQQQLNSVLNDLQYCYFLKIHAGTNDFCHVVAKINRMVQGYKSIQILLMAFKHGDFLQKLILRVIEFIWKYQNAKEVVFHFNYSTSENQAFAKDIKQRLSVYCSVIQKKGRGHHQISLIFVKKGHNQKYIHNPHPEHLHFKLYSIMTTETVKAESQRDSPVDQLHYEYMVIEALKKHTNSEDFLILRDTFHPKNRFRYLLGQLMQLQNHKQNQPEVIQLNAENITDLNYQLYLLKKPALQISDITKTNTIKMVLFEMTLTPAYSLKVVSNWQGTKSHRYHMHKQIDCYTDDEGCQFLLLDVQDNYHLKIIIFKADSYLKKEKKVLYSYMYPKLQKIAKNKSQKYIQNLWIEMGRYPQELNHQSPRFLQTYSCPQFSSVGKQMFIGDSFDWFTDIQIQSGFSFSFQKGDLFIGKSLGVGVITKSGALLYCRIIS